MEKIQFDVGQRSYRINGGGILRFNPGDPNVYARFLEAGSKLQQLEESLEQGAQDLDILTRMDQEMKAILGWVFGPENDFQELLGGVHLLAVAENGKRVLENLLDALAPVLEEGIRCCVAQETQKAVDRADARRKCQ